MVPVCLFLRLLPPERMSCSPRRSIVLGASTFRHHADDSQQPSLGHFAVQRAWTGAGRGLHLFAWRCNVPFFTTLMRAVRRGFLDGSIDLDTVSERRRAALLKWLSRQLLRQRRKQATRMLRAGVRSPIFAAARCRLSKPAPGHRCCAEN